MNPIIGTLMILSSILFAFFGLPILGVITLNILGKAKLDPIAYELTVAPTELNIEPISMPISVKKELHKGHLVWVDAYPISVD